VEIECLPDDIPEMFTLNVGEMMIGQSLRASDIPMVGSMKLLSPADAVISHVVSLRAEEVAPVDAVAAVPEPEVVKKGKKDEEAPAADVKKK
jgi:large subunit ribosomal protein L25